MKYVQNIINCNLLAFRVLTDYKDLLLSIVIVYGYFMRHLHTVRQAHWGLAEPLMAPCCLRKLTN